MSNNTNQNNGAVVKQHRTEKYHLCQSANTSPQVNYHSLTIAIWVAILAYANSRFVTTFACIQYFLPNSTTRYWFGSSAEEHHPFELLSSAWFSSKLEFKEPVTIMVLLTISCVRRAPHPGPAEYCGIRNMTNLKWRTRWSWIKQNDQEWSHLSDTCSMNSLDRRRAWNICPWTTKDKIHGPHRTWSIAYNGRDPWNSMNGVHGPQRGTSMVRNEAGVRTAEGEAHEPPLT